MEIAASCALCGKQCTGFRHCTRCKQAGYCGAACQKEHKKLHKTKCDIPNVTAMLCNAQDMGILQPDTFNAQPSPAQLDGLKARDVVKISVRVPGERFWCIIHAIKGDTITAEVNNELISVPWPLGMKLRFHHDCVYAVDSGVKTDEPYSWLQNQRLVHCNVNR